ncbi:MAG TPA: Fic family protein [Thermoanaerobaculia bacterium]|jgi:Fic family protein
MRRTSGRYERTSVAGEEVKAFVPDPLPPADPPLRLDPELSALHDAARRSLTRLELAGAMVPSIEWFLYAFVRKEAVLSSQIEGTQATLIDLLAYEAEDEAGIAAEPDVEEVCNYLEASRYALGELRRADGLPISMRLLNEAHRRLMRGARGADRQPGEIRRSQNWIGGTRPGNAAFVPPPPQALAASLGALERYVHADDELAPLVRAGLVHVQFETLHPYLDGNGRIGRLLIALLLAHWGLLSQPLLYLSLFFKRHRQEYYRRLDGVRTGGDWEGWTAFFLEGVDSVAAEAAETARELFRLVSADRERVLAAPAATVMSLRLFELLPRHPILTVSRAMKLLDASRPTAGKAVGVLAEAGVLVETTGRKRDRTFSYAAYLDRLRTGTEI